MSKKMVQLAKEQDGFLGMESARNEVGNYGKLLGWTGIHKKNGNIIWNT